MTGRTVLLGATGYTGGLVLDAVLRRGLKPTPAGRNGTSLASLAERHGGLDHVVADVSDLADLRKLVGPGDVLITTAGPFERLGLPVAQAAADVGAHYIDSTGEVGFVRALQDRCHDRARETGPVMLPAFGYDYVPGVLAARLAVRQGGDAVRAVDVGHFATGSLRRGLSQGTRNTGRNGLTLPVPHWHGHRLIDRRPASNLRDFTVRGRRRTAFLLSGTEVLFLPQAFPQLDTVSVCNGWFPALSRPVQAVSAAAATAARHVFGRKLLGLLTRPMSGQSGGPDAAERARTRSHTVAVACDAPDGVPLAEVRLEGPSIYTLTAELIAWGAHRLATRHDLTPGVVGPVEAFGLDALRLGCAEVGLRGRTRGRTRGRQ
ncbi:saccharopine dehydrogenase family protein [Streptomyces sp. NPDC101234]|uniref:saccharopine dehydrogenase family protein n=1 Tax=Streptomyces sp. NPDC101234 TaxID=3366138 RepID=UPI00380091B7